MTANSRYAIYYAPAPGSDLARFGANLLGYDADGGEPMPFPNTVVQRFSDWQDLTRDPRKYGFHATLKAPMSLRPGATEAELVAACANFAKKARAIPAISPVVASLDGFIAIVPETPTIELEKLAADCTMEFDSFRAPLTSEDRERRKPSGLTLRQREHLERWGYPYVMEDFRFHMTLTGRIPADRRDDILQALQEEFAALHMTKLAIDRIVLFRQDSADASFRILRHYEFCNGSPATSMKSMGPPGV